MERTISMFFYNKLIYLLQKTKFLAHELNQIVDNHPDLQALYHALLFLDENDILWKKCVELIATQIEPKPIADALYWLKTEALLNVHIIDVLATHPDLDLLIIVLEWLNYSKILTQQTFEAAAQHPNRLQLTKALQHLYEANILTEENFLALAGSNPLDIAKALALLNRVALLSSDNREKVSMHPYPETLSIILRILIKANLLNQTNFIRIALHERSDRVSNVLRWLKKELALEQSYIDAVFDPAHQLLLSKKNRATLCVFIEKGKLKTHWERLLKTARDTLPPEIVISPLNTFIREEVLAYLSNLANPRTSLEAKQFSALISHLDTHGLNIIWPLIKQAVADRLLPLFNKLYPNKEDNKFTLLMEIGHCLLRQYPRLGYVSDLQKKFSQSEGHKHTLYQMMRSSATFFSPKDYIIRHRHDNQHNQHLYDTEYAITVVPSKN